jgi:hypothetical protein
MREKLRKANPQAFRNVLRWVAAPSSQVDPGITALGSTA